MPDEPIKTHFAPGLEESLRLLEGEYGAHGVLVALRHLYPGCDPESSAVKDGLDQVPDDDPGPDLADLSALMTDGERLAYMGTDALRWAGQFQRTVPREEAANWVGDTGFLVGWFANAIEAGRTAGRDATFKALGSTTIVCDDSDPDPIRLAALQLAATHELRSDEVVRRACEYEGYLRAGV